MVWLHGWNDYIYVYFANSLLSHPKNRRRIGALGSSRSVGATCMGMSGQCVKLWHHGFASEPSVVRKYLKSCLRRSTSTEAEQRLCWSLSVWALNNTWDNLATNLVNGKVSNESVFRTGGRVLSKFCSILLPSTLEALICALDWIRESDL